MGGLENPVTEAPRTSAPEITERRGGPRYPVKKDSNVWFSTPMRGAQRGWLEDIALEGLCIRAMNTAGLAVGQQVVVGIDEWMLSAKIANIVAGDKTDFRLGMEWIHPESTGVAELVDAHRPK
ncbi:MAG TPA: hypothetical protein VJL29_15600 [Thermoguttaceae bacterium]|nr:hypothetical protein [Thermoguttaceae bacterium]